MPRRRRFFFRRKGPLFTLWNVLTAFCFFMAPITTVDFARKASVSIGGYVLALAAGVVMGGLGALGMWMMGHAIRIGAARLLRTETAREWWYRVLGPVTAFLCIAASASAAGWAEHALIRAVG